MKIKMDFVSNSSSTSFVYIASDMISEEDFFDAIGVKKDSPLASFFSSMYYQLLSKIQRGEKIRTIGDVEALVDDQDFTPEVLQRMKDAVKSGKMVVSGSLSSESDFAEGILCTEIFEIDSDKYFLNAFSNYW